MLELKIISLDLNDNRKTAGRWLEELAKSHVWQEDSSEPEGFDSWD